MRNSKPVQPPPPPPVKGAVPLFNPSEIQLEKKDAFLTEKKNSSSILPPSGAPPVPLYNPHEIQLEKIDGFPPEAKNSSSDHGGNPFRQGAYGMDY